MYIFNSKILFDGQRDSCLDHLRRMPPTAMITATSFRGSKRSAPFRIRYGNSVLERTSVIIVSHSILHPGYDDDTLLNDIAILVLPSPLVFSRYVGSACLPANADLTLQDRTGVVAGWGYTSEGRYSQYSRSRLARTFSHARMRYLKTKQKTLKIFFQNREKERRHSFCSFLSKQRMWSLLGLCKLNAGRVFLLESREISTLKLSPPYIA